MKFTVGTSLIGRVVLSTTLLGLLSCGGSSGGGEPTPSASISPRPITQSDLDIAQSIYRGDARTPAGFYSEAPLTSYEYVSTSHLKNADVAVSSASQALFELCTDDWNEALAWSEANAQHAATYAELVETNANERFHEFGRVRPGEPQLYERKRVFKCSYVDRSAADLRHTSGPAGELKQRPLTSGELQRLSEYLWQFTTYNNFGNAVLKSGGASEPGALSHTLHIARLQRGGYSASCDRIDVLAWRHTMNLDTGALTVDVQTLWSFGARESAGVAELCSG